MTMPIFQKADFHGSPYVLPEGLSVCVRGDEAAFAAACFSRRGVAVAPQANFAVECVRDGSVDRYSAEATGRKSEEAYLLEFAETDGVPAAAIRFAGVRGLFYAVNAVSRLLRSGEVREGSAEDYPLFPVRGLIEGFYGKPWSDEERAGMLELLSRHNLNTYFYAPKDDPFHRLRWREPYSEAALARVAQIAAQTAACCMDFVYCVGPGLSMEYSNEKDFEAFVAKLRQVHALGVRKFGLLLDDIPEELQFDGDRARYADLAEAHVHLVNRLCEACREMDDKVELVVCPVAYHGRGDAPSLVKLGRGVPAEVRLFWTGHDICSREITAADAALFEQSTGHKPLVWDNYPVNDANMANEMHLGPLLGRDPLLYRGCEGLVANPMSAAEASKIPLLTVAAYLWNPAAYCPEDAWEDAICQVAGPCDAVLFKYFADHLQTSCLRADNSAIMAGVLYKTRFLLVAGRRQEALDTLAAYCGKLSACRAMLRLMENQTLQRELSRWAEKFAVCCEILESCVALLETGGGAPREALLAQRARYESLCAVLCDFCLLEFTDFVLENGVL